MKNRTFLQLVEEATERLYGERVNFINVYHDPDPDDASKVVVECLGLPLRSEQHFAEVTAEAMYAIWQDNDGLWNDDADKDEALGDFRDLVASMRVAPYMQWTCIYFPWLTQDSVETGEERSMAPGPAASIVMAWNTERGYSVHGQRIGATMVDGLIHFADIDRGIYGVIDTDAVEVEFTPASVLRAYDHGMYNGASTSAPHIDTAIRLAQGAPSIKKD